jgi:hypothetical protein
MKKTARYLKQSMFLPIEVGDIIYTGRFKNKLLKVKEIGLDEKGHPTINGKGILKVRIPKLTQRYREYLEKQKN